MNPWRYGFHPSTGDFVHATGDVTTLSSVWGLDASQIETRLGFRRGRLNDGWSLLFLLEPVRPQEFIWGAVTAYSGGWKFDPDANEYVPVIDLKRAEHLVAHQSDRVADAALTAFQNRQTPHVNVRHGAHRICKVLPRMPEQFKGRAWYYEYPNAPVHDVPQWKLVRRKLMKCVAVIPRHGVFADLLAR